MPARLGAVVTSAAVLTTLALTGCVSGGDDPVAGPPRAETTSVDADEFADDLIAGLEASTTAQLTLTLQSPQGRFVMTGVTDRTTDPASLAGDLKGRVWAPRREEWRNLRIDARSVDGTMYLGFRGRFMAYELDDPDSIPRAASSFVAVVDPLAPLEGLSNAVESVSTTGSQDVAGESLTYYEVTVDTNSLELGDQLTTDEVVYRLWVDDRFRVREVSVTFELETGVNELRVRLYAWGEPVQIEAPPARLVLEPPGDIA